MHDMIVEELADEIIDTASAFEITTEMYAELCELLVERFRVEAQAARS